MNFIAYIYAYTYICDIYLRFYGIGSSGVKKSTLGATRKPKKAGLGAAKKVGVC